MKTVTFYLIRREEKAVPFAKPEYLENTDPETVYFWSKLQEVAFCFSDLKQAVKIKREAAAVNPKYLVTIQILNKTIYEQAEQIF